MGQPTTLPKSGRQARGIGVIPCRITFQFRSWSSDQALRLLTRSTRQWQVRGRDPQWLALHNPTGPVVGIQPSMDGKILVVSTFFHFTHRRPPNLPRIQILPKMKNRKHVHKRHYKPSRNIFINFCKKSVLQPPGLLALAVSPPAMVKVMDIVEVLARIHPMARLHYMIIKPFTKSDERSRH